MPSVATDFVNKEIFSCDVFGEPGETLTNEMRFVGIFGGKIKCEKFDRK
jgi:hypothetical protein